jgi:hypothetical protein
MDRFAVVISAMMNLMASTVLSTIFVGARAFHGGDERGFNWCVNVATYYVGSKDVERHDNTTPRGSKAPVPSMSLAN